jgi:hypothetical protein
MMSKEWRGHAPVPTTPDQSLHTMLVPNKSMYTLPSSALSEQPLCHFLSRLPTTCTDHQIHKLYSTRLMRFNMQIRVWPCSIHRSITTTLKIVIHTDLTSDSKALIFFAWYSRVWNGFEQSTQQKGASCRHWIQ